MKIINDLNIQKMFPRIVYDRGLNYYNNGQVSDLTFDINHDLWTATVHGSADYFVEIYLENLAKGSIKAYCECPAFDTYGSCKHNVAVLLAIAAKTREEEVSFEYEATNRFIEAVANVERTDVEEIQEKVPMHVEYYCKWSYEQNLHIEIKTGERRCYVVKDAEELMEAALNGNEYYFTKSFSFNPDVHYFLKQDMEIFERLLDVIHSEEIYSGYTFYQYEGAGKSRRSIVVPPLLVKELFSMLMKRDFTAELNNETFHHVNMKIDELPFQFSVVKKEEDELLLMMDEVSEGTYFKPYRALFLKGTFYFPTKEQIPILEQIIELGMENHELPIVSDQANTFLSEVVPSLKKVGHVDVAEDVQADIIEVPLRAKLYLQWKEYLIVGSLEYHYGNEQIDPFGVKEDFNPYIIRDAVKERKIMQLIEYANFRYNGKELYIGTDEDELYQFLYRILPLLEDQLEVFLTSDIRNLIIDNAPVPSTNVQVESGSNLLEIGFEIEGVSDDEINEVLHAVVEKKRYYRMNNGALLSLEGEEFTSVKQFLADMDIHQDDLKDGSVSVPVYFGAQIDEQLGLKKNYDPSFKKLLHQLKSPEEQIYELPKGLNATLRNYQQTGYQWFKSLSAYHLGGILADDMGLGKTLQSIAYILSEPSDEVHLIIAPSSVLYNWKNEFHRFAPDLTVAVLTGAPEERKAMISKQQHIDVWITSYATLRQDIELYQELHFRTLILDEAQYIKNYVTKTSKAIRAIRASRRFALSGTPIENSIDELWAIFQVVLPGLMPRQREFRQMDHEKVASLTKPFILRRLKNDVLTELPEKIESLYVSELERDQKELYLGYLNQLQKDATASIQADGFQRNRMKILAGLTRLRQICCHPSLFIENYEGGSGKLDQLMETIRTSIANGKRMLIFSQFTSMHEIIINCLEEEEISYFYLHGQTPSEERVEMSERFNAGENSVFLISLRAGGTGLNLTGADTVILYDLWWNPAVEDQATGRAHRFGQKKAVQVIRLITEGTIEEKIYDLQQKKRTLIDQVIKPGETMLSSLTEEDIRQLLSI